MSILFFLIVLLSSHVVNATTYWVSTSGGAANCAAASGDSDPGAYLTVYQMDSLNCASAGDTAMFKAGTYTGAHIRMELVVPSGTDPLNPSKILCEGNQTCVIQFSSSSVGMIVAREVSHYVIGQEGHGFDSNCQGFSGCNGIYLHISSTTPAVYTNVLIEGNKVRNMKLNGIGNSESQQTGRYYTNVRIRKNYIGYMTLPVPTTDTPHALYLSSDGALAEYNEIYGNNATALQCWHIAINNVIRYNKIFLNGSTIGITCSDNELGRPTNNQIYGNTIVELTANATRCIRFWGDSAPTKVYNNVCHNFSTFIRLENGAGTTSEFKNNVCTGACSISLDAGESLICGGTCSTTNPTVTAASHFRDAANYDFSLISTSTLINAGLDVTSVRACNGTCDIGAHETFAPTGAVIDATFIDITLGMNLSAPPQFVSGTTGWSVNCTGSNCGTPVVSSVSLLTGSSSVVRLTLTGLGGTGVCEAGQTWTWTFNSSTGTVTDSVKIGNTANQRMFTHSTQTTVNDCAAAAVGYPVGSLIYYKLNDGTSGTTPTSAADESGADHTGTLTGGPTWTVGHSGSGVLLTADSGQYIAVPYGSGVNPSTQSLSIAFGVFVTPGQEGLNKGYFGASLGTNQRLYISTRGGSWCIGIQSSSDSACDTALSVQSGWNRLFLTLNSGTDVATICRNGTTGTGTHATKSYTSFTLASNFELGRIGGRATGGGGIFDDFLVWTSVVSCADDYAAWEPAVPPTTGVFSQVAHQFGFVFQNAGSWVTYGSPSATVSLIPGGALSLVTQIDCTGVNCESVGVKLWYSRNGGTAQPVPDIMTSDQVQYYGETTDGDVFTGAATCCLSGGLTANHGTTRLTEAAETFDIGQNHSYTRRVILKFGDSASGTYCFTERDQNGNVLNGSYTPSGGACVTIGNHGTATGPGN